MRQSEEVKIKHFFSGKDLCCVMPVKRAFFQKPAKLVAAVKCGVNERWRDHVLLFLFCFDKVGAYGIISSTLCFSDIYNQAMLVCWILQILVGGFYTISESEPFSALVRCYPTTCILISCPAHFLLEYLEMFMAALSNIVDQLFCKGYNLVASEKVVMKRVLGNLSQSNYIS